MEQAQRAGSPLSTGFIREASWDEIKGVLKHIAFLIGLPDYKKPDADLIIPYMKQKWGHITLLEITVAFESAAEHLFVDLSLEHRTFSPEFIRRVILAYREFTNRQRKAPEDAMTSKQRVGNILAVIAQNDPSLLEDLKKIGNVKKFKAPAEVKRENEADRLYQDLMKEFDILYEKQVRSGASAINAIRAVKYDGALLNIDDYIKVRIEEETQD